MLKNLDCFLCENYHCIIAHFGRYDRQKLIKGSISNALAGGDDLLASEDEVISFAGESVIDRENCCKL